METVYRRPIGGSGGLGGIGSGGGVGEGFGLGGAGLGCGWSAMLVFLFPGNRA